MGKVTLIALTSLILIILTVGTAKASIIVPPDPDPAHLVLWLRFDEASNTYVIDYSGHGNNGTVYGSPQVVPGRYGYGLQFDGVDDYIKVPNSASLNYSNNTVTITAWFMVNEFSNSAGTNWLFIFGQNPNPYINIGVEISTHRVRWELRTNISVHPIIVYSNPIEKGKWYFVALVYDGNTLYAYLNGKLVGTATDEALLLNSNQVIIGSYSASSYRFNGIIDDVRIYNTSLTADQIREMYEALRVKFYDEETLKPLSTANVTIFNANYSINLQVDTVTKEAVLFHSDVPEYGKYYLIATANGYADRHRVIQLSNDSLTEIEVYMPKIENAILNQIIIKDILGEFTKYAENFIRISKGDKIIDEQKLQFGSEPSILKTTIYMLKSNQYIVTVYNEKESRCLGWLSPSLDGVIYLYISKFNVTPIRGDIPVKYNITDEGDAIRIVYETVYGETTSAKVVIKAKNGTVVFEQTLNTPNGTVTFLKDPNEEYIVSLEVDNSVESVKYSTLTLGSGTLAIKLPQLDVGIEGYNFATLPSWIRATFFGGLCIFVSMLFRKRYVPVGLSLSLALAIIFTSIGILELPNTLLLVLAIIVGLAYFVWWRKREVTMSD